MNEVYNCFANYTIKGLSYLTVCTQVLSEWEKNLKQEWMLVFLNSDGLNIIFFNLLYVWILSECLLIFYKWIVLDQFPTFLM